MSQEKKREWATYRRLELDRRHKSRAKREGVEASGIHRYIGGTQERPYLLVLKEDYERFLKEELSHWRSKLSANPEAAEREAAGRTVDWMRQQVENAVYDRLLAREAGMNKVEQQILQQEGRTMTSTERMRYEAHLDQHSGVPASDVEQRARTARLLWMQRLVRKISARQKTAPTPLQHVWQELVGVEDAQQVSLNYINKEKGIAYCQSLNPSVSFRLRGRRELPEQLSKALNLRITKIVFR
ncbi:MAG: hypothetical protein ACFCUX_08975 [Candidatus Methylacidiphilales bacterium]